MYISWQHNFIVIPIFGDQIHFIANSVTNILYIMYHKTSFTHLFIQHQLQYPVPRSVKSFIKSFIIDKTCNYTEVNSWYQICFNVFSLIFHMIQYEEIVMLHRQDYCMMSIEEVLYEGTGPVLHYVYRRHLIIYPSGQT